MNILFVVSEVEGLVKTGGLADVGKALPMELAKQGHDVRVVMPYYKSVAEKVEATQVGDVQRVYSGEREYPFAVQEMWQDGLRVYGVDCAPFFYRDGIYSDSYHAYPDNPERFAFFSRAALQVAQCAEFKPDIIHCNDWHTALTPFFLKVDHSGFFHGTRSILTIHNGAFQCYHNFAEIPILHSYGDLFSQIDGNGGINFLRVGIACADKINAVSPQYGKELLTPLGSHHLFEAFQARMHDVTGILNGCDYSQWDPKTDPLLPTNYDHTSLAGKAICKARLQQEAGLEQSPDTPLIGMVCRLTEQKGFGYIIPIISHLLQHNVQLLIVGTGDPSICEVLSMAAAQYPDKLVFQNQFSNDMAHLLEAGSDFFLMPSLFEPCGLNQMYSLAYGTVPIVRAVGGLRDTVIDLDENSEHSTGFVFTQPDSSALLYCLQRALLFYHEYPERFQAMQLRGMHTRFTWAQAAQSYAAFYEDALRKNFY